MDKNSNLLKISIPQIDKYKQGNMDVFSTYIFLKRNYYSSTIYNFPKKIHQGAQRLSEITGLSFHKSNLILRKLYKDNLIFHDGKNLRLVSFRDLESGAKKMVEIHRNDSVKTISTKLRFLLLKYYIIDKQEYVTNVYRNLNNLVNPVNNMTSKERSALYKKTLKRKSKVKNDGGHFKDPENYDRGTIAGYRKIGCCLGISKSSVGLFLKRLRSWKYIINFRSYIKEADISAADITCMKKFGINMHNYYFIGRGNKPLIHMGTQIITNNINYTDCPERLPFNNTPT